MTAGLQSAFDLTKIDWKIKRASFTVGLGTKEELLLRMALDC